MEQQLVIKIQFWFDCVPPDIAFFHKGQGSWDIKSCLKGICTERLMTSLFPHVHLWHGKKSVILNCDLDL